MCVPARTQPPSNVFPVHKAFPFADGNIFKFCCCVQILNDTFYSLYIPPIKYPRCTTNYSQQMMSVHWADVQQNALRSCLTNEKELFLQDDSISCVILYIILLYRISVSFPEVSVNSLSWGFKADLVLHLQSRSVYCVYLAFVMLHLPKKMATGMKLMHVFPLK